MKNILFVILAFLLLSSCSVKKRSYRKGYHVDWVHHHKKINPKPKDVKNSETKNDILVAEAEIIKTIKSDFQELWTSADKSFKINKFRKINAFLNPDSTCNDIISFTNGKVTKAKVTLISSKEVTYRLCDNLSGPDFKANTTNIKSILYGNGTLEEFPGAIPAQLPINNPPVKPKIHNLTVWALVLNVLSMLVLAISFVFGSYILPFLSFFGFVAALIFSKCFLARLPKLKEKFIGKGLTQFLAIFSAIVIMLFFLVMAVTL